MESRPPSGVTAYHSINCTLPTPKPLLFTILSWLGAVVVDAHSQEWQVLDVTLELISPLDCHSRSLPKWDGLERCSRHRLEERQQIGWSPKDIHEAMVNWGL